jgi:hypothetical protein
MPSCCQGYRDPEANSGDAASFQKVRNAVRATSGQVLTYEGGLIEATYFSCSGGTTEDAVAVWGQEFPYLQAVESPGEEEATYYRDRLEFSRSELEERLGISLNGDPGNWTEDVNILHIVERVFKLLLPELYKRMVQESTELGYDNIVEFIRYLIMEYTKDRDSEAIRKEFEDNARGDFGQERHEGGPYKRHPAKHAESQEFNFND